MNLVPTGSPVLPCGLGSRGNQSAEGRTVKQTRKPREGRWKESPCRDALQALHCQAPASLRLNSGHWLWLMDLRALWSLNKHNLVPSEVWGMSFPRPRTLNLSFPCCLRLDIQECSFLFWKGGGGMFLSDPSSERATLKGPLLQPDSITLACFRVFLACDIFSTIMGIHLLTSSP